MSLNHSKPNELGNLISDPKPHQEFRPHRFLTNIQNSDSNLKSAYLVFKEISNLHIQFPLFYFFQHLFIFLEMIPAIYYSHLPHLWNKSTIYGKILLILNSLLIFTTDNNPDEFQKYPVLIVLIIDFLILLFFTYLTIHLKYKKNLNLRITKISSVVFGLLLVWLYLPTFALFSTTFKFITSRDPAAISFFILYIFVIVYMSAVFYMMFRMLSFMTNPTISSFATYNGLHTSNIFFFNGITIILSQMSQLFAKWFCIVAIIIHMIFLVYQFYDLFSIPFVRLWCIPFFFAFYSAMAISDVLSIISLYGPTMHFTRFVVTPGVFILTWIISSVIFKMWFANISNSFNEDGVMTNDYDHIKTKRQAFIYIHIGFSYLKPCILNGIVPLALVSKFNDYDLLMFAANLQSFFPSNCVQFHELILNLQTKITQQIYNEVLLERLVKLEEMRTKASTTELRETTELMTIKTESAINSIKKFWKNIDSQFDNAELSTIHIITAIINDSNSHWADVLKMYPNDAVLIDLYSTYLIECLGEFHDGLIWKLKAAHLEKGFHAGLDQLFQAFVTAMPKLWHDHMIDRQGNFLINGIPDTQCKIAATAQEKLEEDIDAGVLENDAISAFKWPRLRQNLMKATKYYKTKGLRLARALKYLAFLVILILLIISICIYSTVFSRVSLLHDRIEYIAQIRLSLSNLRNVIFLNYAKQHDLLYSEDDLKTYLPPEALNEGPDIMFDSLNFGDTFKHNADSIAKAFIDVFKAFDEAAFDDQNLTRMVSVFFNETIPRLRKTGGNEKISTFHSSPKNAIISLLWYYIPYSNMSDTELYDNFLVSNTLFETAILHQQFSIQCDNLFQDFYLQVEERCDQFTAELRRIMFIDVFLIAFLCLPLMYIPIILIHLETKKIFKALKTVNSKGAQAASKKLSTNSQINIDYSAIQNMPPTTNKIIVMIVLYTLFFLGILAFILAAFFTCQIRYLHINNLIDLSRYGSIRDSLVSEIFGYMTMISISIRVSDNQYLPYNSPHGDGLKYAFDHASQLLSDYNTFFVQGTNHHEGIYKSSEEIRELHIADKCNIDMSTSDMHIYYKCYSLDKLISSFLLSSNLFSTDNPDTAPDMKSKDYVNLIHMATNELYRNLKRSRFLLIDLINDSADQTRIADIVLLVCGIILLVVNVLLDYQIEQLILKSLKTTLILLRHLPPPSIAETPALIDILLVKKLEQSKVDDDGNADPKQIIFNATQTPIICIGDGFIIETLNKAFRNAFRYSSEQLIGRSLTTLIQDPRFSQVDTTSHDGSENQLEMLSKRYTNEEQGAIRLYNKISNQAPDELTPSKYPVQCICGDDEVVNTRAWIFPVQNKSEQISNFVLTIEDRRETLNLENKLEAIKHEVAYLQQQLIPSEVESVVKNVEDFSIISNCVTVVIVQIKEVMDVFNESNEKLDTIMSSIDNIAKSYPQFIKLRTLFDIVVYIGGLFTNEDDSSNSVHTNVSIDFSKQIKEELNKLLLKQLDPTYSRFAICINTGGPVACYTTGKSYKSFEVFGDIIDRSFPILAAAPPDSIIITEATKELLNQENIEGMNNGPAVFDQNTYLL